jgi:hypothetical protein
MKVIFKKPCQKFAFAAGAVAQQDDLQRRTIVTISGIESTLILVIKEEQSLAHFVPLVMYHM